VNHIAVNQHFPCVAAEIVGAVLLHFLLNQLLFFGRNPNDKLFVSRSVLHFLFAPLLLNSARVCAVGLTGQVFVFGAWLRFGFRLSRVWAAPNKHKKTTDERKRKRLIFGKRLSFCCAC